MTTLDINNPAMFTSTPLRDEAVRLMRRWAWLFVGGLVYALLGVLAIAQPIIASFGASIVLGSILLVSGIVQLVQAFQLSRADGRVSRFLLALASMVAGGIILYYPGVGMAAIVMTLSFYFFMSAFAKWTLASEVRPHQGWGWLTFSAFVSFLAGVVLVLTYPASALIAPGTLLGIELVMFGVSLIGFSLSLRSAYKRLGHPNGTRYVEEPPRRAA